MFRGELLGQRIVPVFLLGKADQQFADRCIARGFGGLAVEPRRLLLHAEDVFADLFEAERPRQPQRLALDEALDVVTADQRQVVAEFFAVEIEQPAAMANLFLRHAGEDGGGGRKRLGQPFGESVIDAAVLFLVRDGERQNLPFGQIRKLLHCCLVPRNVLKFWQEGRYDARIMRERIAKSLLVGARAS